AVPPAVTAGPLSARRLFPPALRTRPGARDPAVGFHPHRTTPPRILAAGHPDLAKELIEIWESLPAND
ncbi:hypothetical protein ADZ36_32370, partial [Streptomyces fradiae]